MQSLKQRRLLYCIPEPFGEPAFLAHEAFEHLVLAACQGLAGDEILASFI